MTFNWKLASGFAVFALVIAVLTGIIAGNPFGTIIVRSLFASVLFGALGTGIGFIVGKYLPELDFTEMSSADTDSNSSEVDIVVPEENPHVRTETDGIIEVADTEFEESDEKAESERNGESEKENGVPEEKPPDEMQPASSEEENRESDALPDIEKMEKSFSSGSDEDGSGPERTEASAAKVEVFGSEQDPSVIAQALRTFIKKDQGG